MASSSSMITNREYNTITTILLYRRGESILRKLWAQSQGALIAQDQFTSNDIR